MKNKSLLKIMVMLLVVAILFNCVSVCISAKNTEIIETTKYTPETTSYVPGTTTGCPNGHTDGEFVVENEVTSGDGNSGFYDKVVYCTECNKELSRETVSFGIPTNSENFTYEVSNAEVTITGYTGSDIYVVIPSEFAGYPVTCIGDYAFSYCRDLKKVTIPDGVTKIGERAFLCCISLNSIKIPDSVMSIGNYAFGCCVGLVSITIPDSVKNIGSSTFSDCENLISIIIPDGVTFIGDFAFYGCIRLTDVYYNGTVKEWNNIFVDSNNECLFNATVHFLVESGEHKYVVTVTSPTCTVQGYSTYVCLLCDDIYIADYIEAKGHVEGEWKVTKKPYVGVAGEETLYCAVCDEAIDIREIPAVSTYFIAAEGSTTVIDKERGIIYGLEEYLYDLEGFVKVEGGTLEYIETENGFGTGTVVNFVVNGEIVESYTIVIFGDITGDGVIDTYDTAKLAAIANFDIELEEDSVFAYAADIAENDGVADTYDLAKLYAVVNGDTTISQIQQIQGNTTDPNHPSGYINPVPYSDAYILSPYGMRTNPETGVYKLHSGVDISCGGAGGQTGPFTKKIVASKAGTVSYAGWCSGYGNTVMITHSDGYLTLYAHNYTINVSVGQQVSQGDQIAIMGTSGNSSSAHCHFEMRDGMWGKTMDPALYVEM